MAVIKSLEMIYLLKNVSIPEYYLGGNVEFLGDSWKNQGLGLAIYTRTYIQNVIPKFESLFGKELKPIKTSMSEGYHPEVDDTPICTEEDSAKYRSIIGCCIWIIVYGRFDIDYATSAMSRLNMSPREGHLKAAKRILAYLKTFPTGRIMLIRYIQIILFIPLKTTLTGRTSIQMLKKRFPLIFLSQRDQKSG